MSKKRKFLKAICRLQAIVNPRSLFKKGDKMQKPKSKIHYRRKGGVRKRLFGTRKPRNIQTERITLRKPLLQFKIFCLEVIINRSRDVSFERMNVRRGFGRS